MQVFKVYFKVLRRNLSSFLMYIGIFVGVFVSVVMTELNSQDTNEMQKCNIAVFDSDNSAISKGFTDYLGSTNNIVVIKDDGKETIQDELYNRNINAAVRIADGFGESMYLGKSSQALEIVDIPGTMSASLLGRMVNSYLNVLDTYISAGFSEDEAIKKTYEVMNDNTMPDIKKQEVSVLKFFFGYLGWVFVAMMVSAVSEILVILQAKNVRERIESSSYRYKNINFEIIGGVFLTGLAVVVVFSVIAVIFNSKEMFSWYGILHIVNMMCMMLTSIAITFAVSKYTGNKGVILILSNVLSLGMSFLCGVFVPLELLSDVVIKIAHFLPVYWYTSNVNLICTGGDVTEIFINFGVQVIFAVAIICIGLCKKNLVVRKPVL